MYLFTHINQRQVSDCRKDSPIGQVGAALNSRAQVQPVQGGRRRDGPKIQVASDGVKMNDADSCPVLSFQRSHGGEVGRLDSGRSH